MDTVSCTDKEPFLKSNWTFFVLITLQRRVRKILKTHCSVPLHGNL